MTSKANNTSKPQRRVGQATKTAAPPRGQTHLPGNAKTPRKPDGSFAKGTRPGPGRAKGQRNRTTVMLKDAILNAAALVGQDGRGANELTGYLVMLATRERAIFARLLERVLPMQVDLKELPNTRYTVQEAIDELNRRGLPRLSLAPPPEQASPVAACEDAIADGEFYEVAPGVERIEQ